MIRNKVPQNEPVHDLLTDRFCDLTTFRCQVSLKIIQLQIKVLTHGNIQAGRHRGGYRDSLSETTQEAVAIVRKCAHSRAQ